MFSLIIPVYNAEKYLLETIDSVINQTIDFEKYIQLILVDDGSTDNSKKICEELQKKFPNNIDYKRINNAGPSAARNIGLRLVNETSNYIGFLDSDDKLSSGALHHIKDFFETTGRNVNIAVLPIYYFGSREGEHKLNYRFLKGNRVIDILNEYDAPQYFIGGSFFKKALINKYGSTFDENLDFWEDALFMNKLILNESCYGVVANGKYFYRKRTEKNSLVDTSWLSQKRYTAFLKNSYFVLFKWSKQIYGEILPYVQYLTAYHIKLYLYPNNRDSAIEIMDTEDFNQFIIEFKNILCQIESKYIVEQDMNSYYKELLLKYKQEKYSFSSSIDKLADKNVTINDVKFRGVYLVLQGHFVNELYEMKKEDRIYLKYLHKKIYAKQILLDEKIEIWGNKVRDYKYAGFKLKLPIWILKFSIGLEGKNFNIILNEVNIFKSLGKKILRTKKAYFGKAK
ncbi:glycosyltransferase family 2 protein [Bacillus halotolerans]|uniref:glycosyltransferase family 2 protein n=1 Tax=Bacillus halotolerans TaxID=260554 RepID=UPI000D038789|nr:glycosyltransferase family 2 protein [Bacillus halotolerans]MBV7319074.1 glycosyltransferase [Halalkalibacterium halodurans]MCV0024111.1 glycosyltransferase [Bacillus sp. XT-2]AZV49877.1 glycosyltransferase family 2 protein [Bacillus halotolerans]PRS06909.1 glycosyltransferase family 2 protein [Bacillus halotolerans]PRS25637.1 glycosyltransferase family 2 protein [Bacillus halotolerans]